MVSLFCVGKKSRGTFLRKLRDTDSRKNSIRVDFIVYNETTNKENIMLTKIKSGASRIGNGILDVTTAIHNSDLQSKIDDLDEQAAALRQQLVSIEDQKTELKDRMI